MAVMTFKIYTKTGDLGETGLFAGGRVSKSHIRVASYGDVDELNTHFGVILAQMPPKHALYEKIESLQHVLFDVGAMLATPPAKLKNAILLDPLTEKLEHWVDEAEMQLPPLKQFILPGGGLLSALLHQARTVCRRAERTLVALIHAEPDTSAEALRFLNRLSDLLFVWARLCNHLEKRNDVVWVSQNK